MVRGIHQFVTGFDYGDAISNYALELRRVIRDMGYESEIYGKFIGPEVRNEALFYTEYSAKASSDNIIIFHFSIGSSVTSYVRSLPDRKVLIYHNITPAEFFDEFDSHVAAHLRSGRKELVDCKDMVELAVGDSNYNCEELRECGFKDVRHLPVPIGTDRLNESYNREVVRRYRDGRVNILFVGRVIPSKKIDDLIKCFYFYKRYVDSDSRLLVVGGYEKFSKYYAFLRELIKRLGVKDVVFTNKVKDSELLGYYRVADIYLSMSEHEGFGIPLLEAMYFGVPVVAYKAAAVPETVGYGGIIFDSKDYAKISELLNRMVSDKDLKDFLVSRGRERVSEFLIDRWEVAVRGLVREITGG